MPRIEKDFLGERELHDDTLYGIQTARALENFDTAGRPVHRDLISAMLQVKMACAAANAETGHLPQNLADAITTAAEDLLQDHRSETFPTDALQGGAGTSTNMNVNEVLARHASNLSGLEVHPSEHVNLHQSTNDTYPTAVRVACIYGFQLLEQSLVHLLEILQDKEREFSDVVKLGRTQLQDAVPITLGREFGAYAGAISRDRWRVSKCVERLRVVNLGGTAVGTGMAAPRSYIFLAIEKLRGITGLGLSRAENLVDATQNIDPFVEVSGMLRAHAANLVKIARDLRLLSSGPRGGIAEIELPAVQPGSSMMPGKVNPVIPEMTMQSCFRVMAHDYEINLAAMSGELELNAFMPLVADAMLQSLDILTRADDALADKCLMGITADALRSRELMEQSHETITALIPIIGHETAVRLARRMREERLSIRDVILDEDLMSAEELEQQLAPEKLCALGWSDKESRRK
ncbi:MAG: aspartate ammonia-lyase [Ectothiorhodospiraceae bacterium]|nr:aspartate ammonia-lyase [Ectothiorhodospiraceae bacterium]